MSKQIVISVAEEHPDLGQTITAETKVAEHDYVQRPPSFLPKLIMGLMQRCDTKATELRQQRKGAGR